MNLKDQPAYIIKMRAKPGPGIGSSNLPPLAWRSPVVPIVSLFFERMETSMCFGTSRYSNPMRQRGPARISALAPKPEF